MGPCPTGYCGHPCTCKSAYDNTDNTECRLLIKILNDRLTDIGVAAATVKHGEPMVAYPTSVVVLKAIYYNYELFKVDHHLHTVVHRDPEKTISTYSGMFSGNLKDGKWVFTSGADRTAQINLRYEIVDYHGEVSVACESVYSGKTTVNGYLGVTPSETYLPKDL